MFMRSILSILLLFTLSTALLSQKKKTNIIKPFNKSLAGVNVSFNCYGKANCSFFDGNITTNEEKGTLATNLGELSYMFNKNEFKKYEIHVNKNHFLITYELPEKPFESGGKVSIAGLISDDGQKITNLRISLTGIKPDSGDYRFRDYFIEVPEVGNFNKYGNEYSDDNYKKKHAIFSEARYREENKSLVTTTVCEFKSPDNDDSNNMVRVILVFGK